MISRIILSNRHTEDQNQIPIPHSLSASLELRLSCVAAITQHTQQIAQLSDPSLLAEPADPNSNHRTREKNEKKAGNTETNDIESNHNHHPETSQSILTNELMWTCLLSNNPNKNPNNSNNFNYFNIYNHVNVDSEEIWRRTEATPLIRTCVSHTLHNPDHSGGPLTRISYSYEAKQPADDNATGGKIDNDPDPRLGGWSGPEKEVFMIIYFFKRPTRTELSELTDLDLRVFPFILLQVKSL